MNATSLLLEPLPADEASLLVDNLLGRAEIPPTARDRILEAAEGNPLFVEEMIGMLIDDGLLRFEEGSWRAVDDLADLTVPPTIQLLLAARLDRLDAEERAVIERGAVEGKVFHTGAVTSLAPEGLRAHVRPRLLALARKELIRPDRAEFAGEDAFRFRHLLIRDAAYQAMPKEQRADLHEGFARWLTEVTADHADEYQEILGHHLEQAYRYRTELGPADDRTRALARDAARALHRSAERATTRGDLDGSAHLLERTIALSTGLERAAAIVDLGENLETNSHHLRALEVLGEFLASPEAPAAPALRIRASIFHLSAESQTNPELGLTAANQRAISLRTEAEAIEDRDALTATLIACGSFAFWLGNAEESRAVSERLAPLAPQMTPTYRGLVCLGFMVDSYFGSAPLVDGFRYVARMREIQGDSVLGQVRCDILEAGLHSMAGDVDAFDAAMASADRGWDEMRNPESRFVQGQPQAESLWRIGREAEAVALMRQMKALMDRIGETGNNATITAELATYLAESGGVEEATMYIDQARAITSPDDFGATVPIGWAAGLVASARGEHDEAVAALDEALRTVRETDYLNFTAETLRIRGQILWAAGRTDEAASSFDEAAALWEHKGNVADLARLARWRSDSLQS